MDKNCAKIQLLVKHICGTYIRDKEGFSHERSVVGQKQEKINKLLHNNNSHKVVFNDICKVLSEILLSNILVISKKGKVLGVSIWPGVDEIEELIEDQVGGYVDKMLNERLLSVLSTKENVNLATLGCRREC